MRYYHSTECRQATNAERRRLERQLADAVYNTAVLERKMAAYGELEDDAQALAVGSPARGEPDTRATLPELLKIVAASVPGEESSLRSEMVIAITEALRLHND